MLILNLSCVCLGVIYIIVISILGHRLFKKISDDEQIFLMISKGNLQQLIKNADLFRI
jgi:hypothetical protein